jgi:biofilm PGA synthesis N-glycosyltransferase PgaC
MLKRYVVITPARNEERTIEHTIRSLISQKIKPEKWVVVDDGIER